MPLRVMVYSHDTFGLGNIRRMLTISEHLLQAIPGVSVLLVTGSPMVHEFRLSRGLDYIKLPCLSRVGKEEYAAKSLHTDITQLLQLRAGLILSAARDFQPDVLLVDKKPDGVKHELRPTLEYLHRDLPACRLALVLRDILDAPEATIPQWESRDYTEVLQRYFHGILVLGSSQVFDAADEYRFSPALRAMTRHTGYLARQTPAPAAAEQLRAKLLGAPASTHARPSAPDGKRLVLVTPGGGEDGFALVRNYIAACAATPELQSLIVCGPEMPAAQRLAAMEATRGNPQATVSEFSGEMTTLMAAADLVVCMGGYNTICELLTLRKPAVVVPRVRPVREQWVRAERLHRLGLVRALHPDSVTPRQLQLAVLQELDQLHRPRPELPLDGLPAVSQWIQQQRPAASLAPASASSTSQSLRTLAWNNALLTY